MTPSCSFENAVLFKEIVEENLVGKTHYQLLGKIFLYRFFQGLFDLRNIKINTQFFLNFEEKPFLSKLNKQIIKLSVFY